MGIKTVFFPDYALQGQDIPAHITWEMLKYEKIRIEFSGPLELLEVYNCEKGGLLERGIIEVEKVGVDGYLGIIFSSRISPETNTDCGIAFSFLGANGETIERGKSKARLFRPELKVIDEIPKEIFIDTDKRFVKPRIKVKNLGSGTVIVNLATTGSSELQRETPHDFLEYAKKVRSDLEEGFSVLTERFPEYSEVISKYLDSYGQQWWDVESFREFKEFVYNLTYTIFKNEKAREIFVETLGQAVLSNIHLLTIPESFLLYIFSIAAQKVYLMYPQNIVMVSREPKILELKILQTDMSLNEYATITIPPISVSASKEGPIEIFRFFEWG